MSRKSRMKNLREKKDRRAKIMAIGGAVLLAVILAWEVPHYLGGSKAPATTTTDAAAAPAPAASSVGTPATATGTAAAVLPTSSNTKLENSDVQPARTKSQLYSFSHFSGKNPFVPQVASSTPGSSTGSTGTTGSSAPQASAPAPSTGVNGSALQPMHMAGKATSATIEVNGKIETENVGSAFPSSSPVFRLVSISSNSAKIGVANGSFSNGEQAVSVAVGKSVTLVNKTNGRRYILLLLSVS
jgi:hypothetical protein